MIIEKINILNFKNIESLELEFSPQVNCMVGINGSGKTNLLDAIYYLSITKSALGLSDGQCVRRGEEFFMLNAQYVGNNSRENVVCSYKKSIKTIKRNSKEYSRISEHIGLLPIVFSAPLDTSLIHESGDERRRFMNAFLSQMCPGYLDLMMKYNGLLAHRNKILKSPASGMDDFLEVVDMQIADLGTQIFQMRREHIEKLAPITQKLYEAISGGRENVEIEYRSALYNSSFEELLKANLQRDYILGHTSSGVHRDDVKLSIEEMPIRKFGSQGQQKSLLLALKLAQAELIFESTNIRPILLLDDVFDKLDMERVANLLKVVSNQQYGQIFITDSNKVRLRSVLEALDCRWKLFVVDEGNFTQEGEV